jgi:hypothetical protein
MGAAATTTAPADVAPARFRNARRDKLVWFSIVILLLPLISNRRFMTLAGAHTAFWSWCLFS